MPLTLQQQIQEARHAQLALDEQRELEVKAQKLEHLLAQQQKQNDVTIAENDLTELMTNEIPITLEKLAPRIQKWVSRYNSAIEEISSLQEEFPLLMQVISSKAARLDACSINLATAKHNGPLIYPYNDGPSSELKIGFNENWIKVAPTSIEIHPLRDFSALGQAIFSKLLLGFVYSGPRSFRRH